MSICSSRPADITAFVERVGRALVDAHGKRRFYSLLEIRDALRASGFPREASCWAFAAFATEADFITLHETLGSPCIYERRRDDVVGPVAPGAPPDPTATNDRVSAIDIAFDATDLLEWFGD